MADDQPAPKTKTRRRAVTALVGITASGIALWLALGKVNVEEVEAAFGRVDYRPLLLTLVTGLTGFFLHALRSRILFGPVGPFTYWDQLRSLFIGYIGNTLFPFRIGELMRMDYLARVGKVRHSACIGGIAVERLLDLAFMLTCFLASIPLTTGAVSATTGIIGLCLIAVLGLVVLAVVARGGTGAKLVHKLAAAFGPRVAEKLRPKLDAFVEGLAALASPRRVLAVGLITIVRWCVGFISIHLWLAAFGVSLPWFAPIVLLASLAFGTALPSAAAFIGTFHYALSTGLSVLGVGDSLAVSISIVAHATATVPWMLTGAVVLLTEIARGRFAPGSRRAAKS
jgi:hypothetical protein